MAHNPEPFAPMDPHLQPDSQLRLFCALFRLPLELPVREQDSWAFAQSRDLGDKWSADTEITRSDPVLVQVPGTLRQPFVWVRVWQAKLASRRVPFDGVQEVAGQIFPKYERFDLPDPAVTAGLQAYVSIAEVVTQFAPAVDDPAERPITDTCFDRCLWGVNRLARGVAAATNDPEFHAYTVEELDPIALVSSRPISGDYDVEPIFFFLHTRFGFPRKTLTEEETWRLNALIELESLGHPFLEYGRLRDGAIRASRSGDYAQSVILASVAGEVLLNLTLRAILVETGRELEITEVFAAERGGLMFRLRHDFAPLLGGEWNPDRAKSSVGRWVHATQLVRHRVVHAGHDPTKSETVDALQGEEALQSFLFQRLVERRYRYPKTTLSAVGEASLRRRNLWNARMQEVSEAVGSTMPDFWRAILGK